MQVTVVFETTAEVATGGLCGSQMMCRLDCPLDELSPHPKDQSHITYCSVQW
jgi:hypothetical protein